MTEYCITILNDSALQAFVITFAGLFMTFFLVGYFISLMLAALYKITHKG